MELHSTWAKVQQFRLGFSLLWYKTLYWSPNNGLFFYENTVKAIEHRIFLLYLPFYISQDLNHFFSAAEGLIYFPRKDNNKTQINILLDLSKLMRCSWKKVRQEPWVLLTPNHSWSLVSDHFHRKSIMSAKPEERGDAPLLFERDINKRSLHTSQESNPSGLNKTFNKQRWNERQLHMLTV